MCFPLFKKLYGATLTIKHYNTRVFLPYMAAPSSHKFGFTQSYGRSYGGIVPVFIELTDWRYFVEPSIRVTCDSHCMKKVMVFKKLINSLKVKLLMIKMVQWFYYQVLEVSDLSSLFLNIFICRQLL